MRIVLVRILALCIIAGAFIPFIMKETPSLVLLTLYGAFIVAYLALALRIRFRFPWKLSVLSIVLIFAGAFIWDIATVLPPVVFVFFIAFLVSFLLALFLIAALRESRHQ